MNVQEDSISRSAILKKSEMPIKTADVEKEYIKNKDLVEEDVEALKEWVKRQPHLPEMSELQVILFLQSCYCKIEPAKRTIDAFFSLKAHYPEFFADRDPNSARNMESMNCCVFIKLPKLTREGYDVLFITFMDDNPHSFTYTDQVKIFDMNMRLWLEENGTSKGLIIVLDMGKFGLVHFGKLGIMALKGHITYLQDALPVRLKGLHFVNAGSIMDKLMALIKPFLKKELAEILYMHKDLSESLYKFVPQECLPSDFGGAADCLETLHDTMKNKLMNNAEYFIRDEMQVADDSKRIVSRSNSITEDIEIEGSFRKLEID